MTTLDHARHHARVATPTARAAQAAVSIAAAITTAVITLAGAALVLLAILAIAGESSLCRRRA